MIPVHSTGLDALVPATGQLVGTIVTSLVAMAALIATLAFCYRRRIRWPLLVVVSGTATFLLEPLFDHLHGLWFYTQGQWTAVVTYGIHIPVWLPIIYVAYYGCGTVWYWARLERGVTMREVFVTFTISFLLAGVCEEFYINFVGLYAYQDRQPFMVLNYPLFMAIVNGVPPMLSAIVLYRLVPLLKGWEKLAILGVVPVCFAASSFGCGFLYLAARQSQSPSMLLLTITAIIDAAGAFGIIWIAAKLAGVRSAEARSVTTAAVLPMQRS